MPTSIDRPGLVARLRRRLANGAVGTAPAAVRADSGRCTLDEYLTRHYQAVPGFSSLFSAEVAGRLLAVQTDAGIAGHIGEIGVLMGRSFIGLALGSAPDDICIAIDEFQWPQDVQLKFMENCRRFGVAMDKMVVIKADSTSLVAENVLAKLDGRKLRYMHIDGDHSPGVLLHDLALARDVLEPGGIICLDDMLHPQYPELALTVHAYLSANPGLVVFCVIDRADMIAASKYLICARDYAGHFQAALKLAFSAELFPDPAEFSGGPAMILSKDTTLLPHYRAMIEPPPAAGDLMRNGAGAGQ